MKAISRQRRLCPPLQRSSPNLRIRLLHPLLRPNSQRLAISVNKQREQDAQGQGNKPHEGIPPAIAQLVIHLLSEKREGEAEERAEERSRADGRGSVARGHVYKV